MFNIYTTLIYYYKYNNMTEEIKKENTKNTSTTEKKTQQKKSPYQTHWHSFWFGFMSALAVVLFFLLLGTITNRVSFGTNSSSKKVAIKKTETTTVEKEEKTPEIKPQDATELAKAFNVDKDALQTCIDERRYAQKVKDDIKSGKEAGVQGTPHSFVLIDDAMYEIPGAYSEEGMREFFDDLLAGKDPRAKDLSDTRTLAPINDTDWVRGDDNARITVVEYTDVDCPFCKKFHEATNNIMGDYPNDVRWVVRHMPSDGLHPDARAKAEVAECLGELGGAEAFWKYFDTMLQ
jgi:protein-disulfide isomerase